MAKAKKFKGLKSSCTNPKTRGKKLRLARLEITETLKEDGEIVVDIDFKDSQMREFGELAMFDASVLMVKNNVQSLYKDMAKSIGEMVTFQSEKVDVILQQNLEIAQLRAKLDNIRNITLNIHTGRGGSDIKSDSFTIKKQLMEVLNG